MWSYPLGVKLFCPCKQLFNIFFWLYYSHAKFMAKLYFCDFFSHLLVDIHDTCAQGKICLIIQDNTSPTEEILVVSPMHTVVVLSYNHIIKESFGLGGTSYILSFWGASANCQVMLSFSSSIMLFSPGLLSNIVHTPKLIQVCRIPHTGNKLR